MRSQKRPTVLAIVVTYNAEKWLPTCIGSLVQSDYPVSVALVDNNSSDNTVALLEKDYKGKIDFLHLLKENLGFGRAHNLVLKQDYARNYDYFFLLNQDAAIVPKAIRMLVKIGERQAKYGIISPVHFFSSGVMDRSFNRYLSSFKIRKDSFQETDVYVCEFINAAIWLVKAEVVDAIGGFDPVFKHYGEDRNFVHRCINAGWEVVVVENARGFHYRPQLQTGLGNKPIGEQRYITSLIELLNPSNSLWLRSIKVLFSIIGNAMIQLAKGNLSSSKGLVAVVPKILGVFPQLLQSRTLTSKNQPIGLELSPLTSKTPLN